MPLRREWIDWTAPLLPAASAWLLGRTEPVGPDRRCDLSGVLCVVSGRRGGRVLLAQLLQQARVRSVQLIPPVVVTPGSMHEQLLSDVGREATANEPETQLAWIAAMRELDSDSLRMLVPHRPEDRDLGGWRALADVAARLHAELAGEQLSFERVADHAERMELTGEGDRWRALQQAERLYHQILSQNNLLDPHRAVDSALRRRVASASRFESIILIGVVDLNATQRLALAPLADRVVALVHAPASMASRFDDLGCVAEEAWQEAASPLTDDQIIVTEGPADQAQAVLRVMAGYRSALAPSQITIGLGDAELAPVIVGHGEWAGVPMRAVGSLLHRDSGPHRFLAVAADWLEEQRFVTFSELLRHPDVDQWLADRSSADVGGLFVDHSRAVSHWLTLLDQYFSEHLHEKLDGAWLGSEEVQRRLKKIAAAIDELLSPLLAMNRKGNQSLGVWAPPILKVLGTLYERLGDQGGSPSAMRSREACFIVRDALAPIAAAPVSLQPTVDAASAIRHVLAAVMQEPLADALEPSHVEMLGWLELHTDLAPALIITSFNEGFVPQSITADAFLPDTLRKHLGLMCNERRYARDCYLLHAIVHSRPQVSVITGRTTADGDPLTPSRLLLAGDDQTLVRRVRQVSGSDDSVSSTNAPIGLPWPEPDQSSQFEIPKLPAIITPDSLRVTDFRTYLACPYRFALGRIVGLETCDAAAAELDALHFGSLAHEVLQTLGEDAAIARSTDAATIEQFLESQLDRQVKQRYGRKPPPAVQVQAAQLKARLRAFSQWQARHAGEGWRIMHCEHVLDRTAILHFDDPAQASMPITGTIDRIDRQEQTGEWLIADYKTGDSGRSPYKTHHNSDKLPDPAETHWADLQLPLYDYLARQSSLGITGTVRLGYIVLPRQTDGATFLAAEWTSEHLRSAIDAARHVVVSLRAGQYLINREFDSPFDSFARICQTTVFKGGDDDGDDNGGGES